VTARPSYVCPRCGSADVHPVEVFADGQVRVACSNPNCGHRWPSGPVPVERLPELRDLGARLLGHQRTLERARREQSTPRVRHLKAMASHAIDEVGFQIIDLVAEAVAA